MENQEISTGALKDFFENYKKPLPQSLLLYPGTTITDVPKYISSYIAVITAQGA